MTPLLEREKVPWKLPWKQETFFVLLLFILLIFVYERRDERLIVQVSPRTDMHTLKHFSYKEARMSLRRDVWTTLTKYLMGPSGR